MADDKRMIAALKAGISREEAEAMFAEDKLIDKGQVMEWDLPPEEHKKAMKYANSDEKKKKHAAHFGADHRHGYRRSAGGRTLFPHGRRCRVAGIC